MTKSEELIEAARRRSEERRGLRVKVRLSVELKTRAVRCAEAVGESLMDWTELACNQMKAGKYNGVAWEPETQKVTREGSEAVAVRAPKGLNPAQIRLALACAVVHCERVNPPKFECALVEGRDYVVEAGEG